MPSKPPDPREQAVQEREPLDESLRSAIRATHAERAAFTKATGIPLDDEGFMLLPSTDEAVRREQLQRLAAVDMVRDLVRTYGLNRVVVWARNAAATTDQGGEEQ